MAPFKSNLGRDVGKILKVWNTGDLGDGLGVSTTTTTGPLSATGGTILSIGSYTYHVFTSNDTF